MSRVKAKHDISDAPSEVNEKTLKLDHIPAYFLMGSLLIVLYFLYVTLAPFFTVMVFAAVLATAFYPAYRQTLRVVKHPVLASIICCILVTLLIVIPFIVVFFMLASEAVNAYAAIQMKINSGFLDPILNWQTGGVLHDAFQRYLPGLNLNAVDLTGQITSVAQRVSSFLLDQTQAFVSGLFGLLLSFLIMGVTLFYFFKDGPTIAQKLLALSPLPRKHEKRLLIHLHGMTRATLYGTFLTAIIQGVIGGVGFAISGLGEPVLWGTVMAFFALLPYVGTGLVWVPGTLVLLATGHTGSAIFLFLWGMFIVGTVDNFLRPYFIGSRTKSDSLLTFLVVLGGVIVWGFPGVVFGPLVLTMLTALVEIYEQEYRPVLKNLDHEGV